MKLIFCTECKDVLALHQRERKCMCGKSAGRYKSITMAEISGMAIPIGFDNNQFIRALSQQPDTGTGQRFNAFVFAKNERAITRKV